MAFTGERHIQKFLFCSISNGSGGDFFFATNFIRQDLPVREGRAHALVTIFPGRHRGFLCKKEQTEQTYLAKERSLEKRPLWLNFANISLRNSCLSGTAMMVGCSGHCLDLD